MKISEIESRFSDIPTIMDISDELFLIKMLMQVETNDLIKNKNIFFNLIELLELSHMDNGFIEVTKDNEGYFLGFYKWLIKLNSNYDLNIKTNTIEIFNITSDEVNNLMNK
ncbi:hypothetical protein FJU30_09240 [Affinibrenneria salicis]|uniref:Uncharacterized protein n=1 Tax=Affinibrenneria salicis TaxID=2590031 RepID=A0A5J5G2Y3_9GAMM|nr:hypothetical protein [Affinibrenneria salicis]KAA9000433.1 hypothetical protein FJU30_09240 [Affinibrenneria salicis]